MKMLSKQEMFDKCATHLFTQGRKSWSDLHNICMYRDEEGRKCAVGCFISDKEYDLSIEGNGVYDLRTIHPSCIPWSSENDHLASRLQDVHDEAEDHNWYNTGMMRKALQNVAELFDLDYSILNKLSFSDR